MFAVAPWQVGWWPWTIWAATGCAQVPHRRCTKRGIWLWHLDRSTCQTSHQEAWQGERLMERQKQQDEEDAPRNHYNWGDRHLIEDEKVESIYWGEEGCPAWLREKRLEYQRKHFGEDYIVPWRPSSSLFLVSQTCRSSRDKNACSCADWWLPLKVLDSIATCYPMQKKCICITYVLTICNS